MMMEKSIKYEDRNASSRTLNTRRGVAGSRLPYQGLVVRAPKLSFERGKLQRARIAMSG